MITSLSGQHKCNTTTIQLQYNNFFLYCSCIALVWTPAIQSCNTSFLQLAENLQATCSRCQKNLYRSSLALVWTAAIQQNFCVISLQLHCTCVDRFTGFLQNHWVCDTCSEEGTSALYTSSHFDNSTAMSEKCSGFHSATMQSHS